MGISKLGVFWSRDSQEAARTRDVVVAWHRELNGDQREIEEMKYNGATGLHLKRRLSPFCGTSIVQKCMQY